MRKRKPQCDKSFYFFASGLTVCYIFAVYRIVGHFSNLKESSREEKEARKYLTKCGCLQIVMNKLGFDSLTERLAGQPHYEKYKDPVALDSLVPPPCVDLIDDIDMKNSSAMKRMDERCYRQVMNPKTRKSFAKEANELIKHLQGIGVWVAMAQGTALGSQRAHGFLPWDDDLDFMVLYRDRDKIEKKLVEVGKQKGIKFVIDKTDTIGRYRVKCDDKKYWCGMVIDLWYVELRDWWLKHYSAWMPMQDILPLRQRPFEGYWFPAPYNMDNYLKSCYTKDYFGKCVFHNHQYKAQKPKHCPKLPCSKLKWRKEFPHVEFCHLKNGWSLELYIIERKVHSIYLYRT